MSGVALGVLSLTLVVAAEPAAAQAVSAAAQDAQARLAESATIEPSRLTGLARFVRMKPGQGLVAAASASTPEQRARFFFAIHGRAFGLAGPDDLALVGPPVRDALSMDHVRFQQRHRGVLVSGAQAMTHLRGNRVVAVNGRTLDHDALAGIDLSPAVDPSQAQGTARGVVEARGLTVTGVSEARLELFNRGLFDGQPTATRLAWFVVVRAPLTFEYVWVDAQAGSVLLNFNQQPTARDRRIFNAYHDWVYPGTLVRTEGGPATGDADADAAYEYAGDTYDYFYRFGRDSIDGAGQPLLLTVHYGLNYPNAGWDPDTEQMVFGDGAAQADDVTGHELTHGLTQHTADLYYYRQSGALNESFSDIFGEVIDLGNGAGTDTPEVRWLAGEDWLGLGPIRDMMDPNAFGQPAKLSDPRVVCSDGDGDGVHTNSGILNHAFALMADGGDYNGQLITGIGLDKAGAVMFRTLTVYLLSTSDLLDADSAARQACTDLVGSGGLTASDCVEVGKALTAVELGSAWPCDIALTVSKRGTGSGTVTSTPTGIACGADCTEVFPQGTSVRLTAAADTGSVFAGWRAPCSSSDLSLSTCTLAPSLPAAGIPVTATFDPVGTMHTATVSVTGDGTVTSLPAGIDCGATCSASYASGTRVTLTAVPTSGYTLSSWGGDCSGRKPTCILQMDAAKSVTTTFVPAVFTPVSTVNPGTWFGGAAWGDYDNDGDLDLVSVGADKYGIGVTRLWRNDSGTLVDSGATLPRVDTFASWADFDNDGDVDLLVSGYTGTPVYVYSTQLLRNDSGTFVRVDDGSLLSGPYLWAAWGDYDNDGDLDLALANNDDTLAVYRNDGAGLLTHVPLGGGWGQPAWGDYDNDGDLDLAVPDYSTTGSHLLRNESGAMVDAHAGLGLAAYGSASWGDYDNDGQPDLALTGYDGTAVHSWVYHNASGTFSDVGAPLTGIAAGDASWGDTDGDGDLDLLLAGATMTSAHTDLYRNDSGSFVRADSGLVDSPAAAALGDYDNDGRLDVFLPAGDGAGDTGPWLYHNIRSAVNAPPTAPAPISALVSSGACVLNWSAATDSATPAAGLTYNVRVGTTPGGSEAVPAMADPTTGFRRIVGRGNAGSNTSMTLRNVGPGRYYWAVQAIDASYAGSPFSETGQFLVPTPVTLSVNDIRVTEASAGTTEATFTVSLSTPAVQEVTVEYATADGTATLADNDYVRAFGTLTFAAGQTTQPVTVLINGDDNVEPNETFVVNLTGAVGATIARAQGTATIVNDEVTTEPVLWTSEGGVTASENNLTKTAADGWGNAGAVSTRAIAFGDGYMQFVASETTTARMLGLSNGDKNWNYPDIDFGIYLTGGRVMVYEAGVARGEFGAYATNDVLRVVVSGGVVTYSLNGTAFYTSPQTPVYPLLVDTALLSQGGTIQNVLLSGALISHSIPPPAAREDVVWTNASGVAVSGNNLTKTSATGWGNSGAVSTRAIASGDGYVEIISSEVTAYRMFGLSNGDSNQSYSDIDFALYLDTNRLRIFEGGTERGAGFGTYAVGDLLRVSIEGGLVVYRKNGTLLYTSTVTPTYPLLCDTALNTTGATIQNVVLSGSLAGPTPTPTPVPTPTPTPGPIESVAWTSASGVAASGNNLTKTSVTGWGNSGAVSTRAIASGDGYVEITASEVTTYRMFGLSNGDSNQGYSDIDFALYLDTNRLRIFEGGTERGTGFGAYAVGDLLRVSIEGGLVVYRKNGTLLYTSAVTPTYPLLCDTALNTTGATLQDVMISGDLTGGA